MKQRKSLKDLLIERSPYCGRSEIVFVSLVQSFPREIKCSLYCMDELQQWKRVS
jgi:hypothetical protein